MSNEEDDYNDVIAKRLAKLTRVYAASAAKAQIALTCAEAEIARARLVAARDALAADRERGMAARDRLVAERDALRADNDRLAAEIDAARAALAAVLPGDPDRSLDQLVWQAVVRLELVRDEVLHGETVEAVRVVLGDAGYNLDDGLDVAARRLATDCQDAERSLAQTELRQRRVRDTLKRHGHSTAAGTVAAVESVCALVEAQRVRLEQVEASHATAMRGAEVRWSLSADGLTMVAEGLPDPHLARDAAQAGVSDGEE